MTVTLFCAVGGGNRLTGEFNAAALGNGCSPAATAFGVDRPAGGVLVCPQGTTLINGSTQCTGSNINPPS